MAALTTASVKATTAVVSVRHRPQRAALRPSMRNVPHSFQDVAPALPELTKNTLAAAAAVSIMLAGGPALAGSQQGIVQPREHWEAAAKRGMMDMGFKSENAAPLASNIKDDPVHHFLSGKFPKSSIPGFSGASSDLARKAAEQLDVDAVMKGIDDSPIAKFRHAMADRT